MRELSMGVDEYKRIQQKEYSEAKANPEQCGPAIVDELEQYNIMQCIRRDAQEIRQTISKLDSGEINLSLVPLDVLREYHQKQFDIVERVDGFFSRLREPYQDAIKEAYKSFSTDQLHLMKTLEQELERLEE